MKSKLIVYFIFSGLALMIFNSCQSPSEIDSPYKKIDVTNRIVPNLTYINLKENEITLTYTLKYTSCMIDTSATIPFVWMDMEFNSASTEKFNSNGIGIDKFSIVLDSLPVVALIEYELVSPETGSWTSFILNKTDNSKDTLKSGMGNNITSVSFNFNKQRKELNAFIYTKLFFMNNQTKDSTNFMTTLRFQY
ncbi:MAG: hypothetical protein HZB41_14375 [Ignavibacteriae bacterium]|nr:hypothetical protein [Ignavibacteriota bacterium]